MKNTLTTGIVGYGTVGQATALLFEDVAIYDPPKGYTDLSALARCPVSFVCVPTPTLTDGRCDLSFVYDAVSQVAPILSDKHVLVIRSTVPPAPSVSSRKVSRTPISPLTRNSCGRTV